MECKKRLALWCSVAILIFSIVLLSLYLSCMNVCEYQHKSYYAPIWTAVLGIILAVFGFMVSSWKLDTLRSTIYATASVIFMICALVCIYLIIGGLIGEIRHKSGNTNSMTAMFLWIAMASATGVLFCFTTIIACGFVCCGQKREDENARASALAASAWATPSRRHDPVAYTPESPPPYSPTNPEETTQIAPTAPPLFLSNTLQREQGMAITPSSDRRSFSANLVEISEGLSAQDLTAEMNEYSETSGTFFGNHGNDQDDNSDNETGTGLNAWMNEYTEMPTRSGNEDVKNPVNNHDSATETDVVNGNSSGDGCGSIETDLNVEETPTLHSPSDRAVDQPEIAGRSPVEIPSQGDADDADSDVNDYVDIPDQEDGEVETKTTTEDDNDYAYATTGLRLVHLTSLDEDNVAYVNDTRGSSPSFPR